MKKLFIILAFALIIFSTIQIVSAWSPEGHTLVCLYVLDNSNSSTIQSCQSKLDRDAFLLGCETPDLAVIFYYTCGSNGCGGNYKITHNWNFADQVERQAITEDERCFSYGISAHLIADSVSHTDFVPELIKRTHVPNWLIHPLGEQKYGAVLASEDPNLEDKVSHMMDALFINKKGQRYSDMVQVALGKNSGINASNEMTKLALSLNTFYATQYRPTGGSSVVYQLYPIITSITNFVQPVVGAINHGQADEYFAKAKRVTLATFGEYGSRYNIREPHGFTLISNADSEYAGYFNILYLAIALLPPFGLLLWRRLKTKKFNWFYLALIPAIMVLEIIVVYIMI